MPSSPFAQLEQLIAPSPAAARVAFLTAQPFAHRGLHGEAAVEHSRAAFRAAIALGHGIELDVQPAAGGEAFVFHDDELDRLTTAKGRVSERRATELDRVVLAGSGERIPRLTEVLGLIGGRVPVLIEVKASALRGALCLSVRRALEGYRGPAAIMSFDPRVPRWFAEHSPRTVRGLVVTERQEPARLAKARAAVERWAALASARPDFLAYDVRDLPSRFAARARARGLPVLTWTVRDEAAERVAALHADEAIYERPR